ncbi:MAG TPA: tRNA (guanosine(46)-N7)-methyltransferase TrmB [Dermatophilaceae bacterium]|nr:tRNA (guanosine(46)-N7)-methyltransferase TrmB [Dermatophilaceae bacterium]
MAPLPAQSRPLRREIVSFGRRDGRASRRLLEPEDPSLAPYLVTPPRGGLATSIDPQWRFDPAVEFGRASDVVVEIGTGTGEAILAAAQGDPEADHLGVEVYRPGLARTVRAAQRAGLGNLRMIEADARALLARALPDGSLAEVRVFFPDPWPKPRHHKRRLVDGPLLADVARLLRPGGAALLATDWPDYAKQIRDAARRQPTLVDLDPAETVSAGRSRQVRPVTKFEQRAARDGRSVCELRFRRM